MFRCWPLVTPRGFQRAQQGCCQTRNDIWSSAHGKSRTSSSSFAGRSLRPLARALMEPSIGVDPILRVSKTPVRIPRRRRVETAGLHAAPSPARVTQAPSRESLSGGGGNRTRVFRVNHLRDTTVPSYRLGPALLCRLSGCQPPAPLEYPAWSFPLVRLRFCYQAAMTWPCFPLWVAVCCLAASSQTVARAASAKMASASATMS
jgi:hypothetical protein